ncbi:MAG: hypothetical protein GX605_06255, partial [Chloroflexi bacterium]|nr:hypothetical protein [Chloroflexota bacterium]
MAALNTVFAEFDAKHFGGSKPDTLAAVEALTPAPSVVIDSGGGYHCYWLLQAPYPLTGQAERERAKDLQRRWVTWAGGDKGSQDLARVLRVPGTHNQKYPDRPEVRIVRADLGRLYDLDALEAYLPSNGNNGASRPAGQVAGGAWASASQPTSASAWASAALQAELDAVRGAAVGTRNATLNHAAFKLGQIVADGHLDAATVEAELIAAGLAVGLGQAEVEATVKSGLGAGMSSPRGPAAAPAPPPTQAGAGQAKATASGASTGASAAWWQHPAPVSHATTLECLERGETGDAELLAGMFVNLVVFDHSQGAWYNWAGHHWERDELGFMRRLVSGPVAGRYLHAAGHILGQLPSMADPDERARAEGLRRELAKRAGQLRAKYRIDNVLSLATAIPGLALSGDGWDRDPWVLG